MIKPLFVIFACLALGDFLSSLIAPVASIPGSIIGLLAMFFLLRSGAVRLKTMEATSNLLVNNLGLFFIPPTVGVMAYYKDIVPELGPILATVILSTFVVLMATGLVHQLIRRLG